MPALRARHRVKVSKSDIVLQSVMSYHGSSTVYSSTYHINHTRKHGPVLLSVHAHVCSSGALRIGELGPVSVVITIPALTLAVRMASII